MIPGNVKEVGDSAFEGTFKATTLKKLTIEEGVEVIGKYNMKEIETMEIRNASNAKDVKYYTTERLREEFHIANLFTKDLNRAII